MEKPDVLVVEDDVMIRQLYVDALEAAKLTVETAENGEEGLKKALQSHPNVILIDILMPVMNGHEAVSKLRKDDWGKDARIIYLTNLSDPADVITAIEHSPEEYIVKANTDVKEVVNMVRTAMYA